MRALRHVVVVKRAEHGSKGVGINDMPVAARVGSLKAQWLAILEFYRTFKETSIMGFNKVTDLDPIQSVNRYRVSPVDKSPAHKSAPDLMQAKNRERIMVLANDKSVNFSLT